MKRAQGIKALLSLLLPAAGASGADFPLEWRPLSPRQAALCYANGPSTGLAARPPSSLRRQPKAISRYPLYGRLQVGMNAPLVFRLDESQGSRNGYDRLIFDFNRNADLTDDPEHIGIVQQAAASPYAETSLFGPVDNLPEWKAGPWPAPLCIKVSLRKRAWWARLNGPVLIGELDARPAWYLQTTVTLGELREPLGILDCNCDFNLGETPSLMYFGPFKRLISFIPGDLLLRDDNHNGAFDFNVLDTDTQTFSHLFCAGTNVLRLHLDPNLRFVRLQSYAGPVGIVELHPQLQSAVLALWGKGIWSPVSIRVEHGRATVPAGTYAFYSCLLEGVDTTGHSILARASNHETTNRFQVAQGRTTPICCGPPLDLRVDIRRYPSHELQRRPEDLCLVDINVRVIGAGGEVYTSYAPGPDFSAKSPPPRFRVVAESGQVVCRGQLEYG